MDAERNEKIAKQVERWDLYARLTPTAFLVTATIMVVFNIASQQTVIIVGLTGFAFTAVVWWWWAIFTIKYLVTVLNRTSNNLQNAATEISQISTEVEKLRNECATLGKEFAILNLRLLLRFTKHLTTKISSRTIPSILRNAAHAKL